MTSVSSVLVPIKDTAMHAESQLLRLQLVEHEVFSVPVSGRHAGRQSRK
jgi:hypothetical protein